MKSYEFDAANMELTLMAIQRYRGVATIEEFGRAQLLATGIDVPFLQKHPDLDAELTLAYEGACARTGRDPYPSEF